MEISIAPDNPPEFQQVQGQYKAIMGEIVGRGKGEGEGEGVTRR